MDEYVHQTTRTRMLRLNQRRVGGLFRKLQSALEYILIRDSLGFRYNGFNQGVYNYDPVHAFTLEELRLAVLDEGVLPSVSNGLSDDHIRKELSSTKRGGLRKCLEELGIAPVPQFGPNRAEVWNGVVCVRNNSEEHAELIHVEKSRQQERGITSVQTASNVIRRSDGNVIPLHADNPSSRQLAALNRAQSNPATRSQRLAVLEAPQPTLPPMPPALPEGFGSDDDEYTFG